MLQGRKCGRPWTCQVIWGFSFVLKGILKLSSWPFSQSLSLCFLIQPLLKYYQAATWRKYGPHFILVKNFPPLSRRKGARCIKIKRISNCNTESERKEPLMVWSDLPICQTYFWGGFTYLASSSSCFFFLDFFSLSFLIYVSSLARKSLVDSRYRGATGTFSDIIPVFFFFLSRHFYHGASLMLWRLLVVVTKS